MNITTGINTIMPLQHNYISARMNTSIDFRALNRIQSYLYASQETILLSEAGNSLRLTTHGISQLKCASYQSKTSTPLLFMTAHHSGFRAYIECKLIPERQVFRIFHIESLFSARSCQMDIRAYHQVISCHHSPTKPPQPEPDSCILTATLRGSTARTVIINLLHCFNRFQTACYPYNGWGSM